MPEFQSTNLGNVPYQPEAVIEFPRGLPGFDERRRFVAVRLAGRDPLVFLQSLEDAGLCFLTLPVRVVEPAYRLEMTAEDRELLGLAGANPPVIGEDVMCLAVVAARETETTANLLAPLVVNLGNRRAVQAVAPEPRYSHRHRLAPEAPACS
jgi:flagellar assembly factor FliW